jgi:hypothetical protein
VNFITRAGGRNPKTLVLKIRNELFACDRLVFDDQNMVLFCHGSLSGWNVLSEYLLD